MRVMQPSGRLLVTIPEAGEILSVSRSSIYKLISEGRLPVLKLNGGRSAGARIRVKDLERFVEDGAKTSQMK